MSRIGKQPIKIPDNATVNIDGNKVSVKGPKGELSLRFKPEVEIKIENKKIVLSVKGKNKFSNSLYGLYRSLIANMIHGVTLGWNKGLEITGVGYKASVSGDNLVLNVGFSHPILFPIPKGVTVAVSENKINVSGCDKQLVGETAARIRKIKPPEPYKGKGIHYIGEQIRRKAGKVVKVAGGVTAGK